MQRLWVLSTVGMLAVACSQKVVEAPDTAAAVGGDGPAGRGVGVCPADFPAAGDSFDVGAKIPNITLKDCSGTVRELRDVVCKETLTLVYIGAGWCQPCREKQHKLQELFEGCKGDDFTIVDILAEQNNPGSPPTKVFCQQWTDEYALTFPVWMDQLSAYWKDAAGTQGTLPVVMLVDNEWNIVYKCVGCDGVEIQQVVQDFGFCK